MQEQNSQYKLDFSYGDDSGKEAEEKWYILLATYLVLKLFCKLN